MDAKNTTFKPKNLYITWSEMKSVVLRMAATQAPDWAVRAVIL